jgi:glutamate--cysteine ligase
LRRGGVEYVEVRSLDLNIFDPVGVNQNAMRFIEAFLIYCLLADSPPIDDPDWLEIAHNHGETARNGRDPAFRLLRDGKQVSLAAWATEIVEDVRAIAELIDRGEGGDAYASAVDAQAALIGDADATPSARVIDEMRRNDSGFFHFAMDMARGHKQYFRDLESLAGDRLAVYADEAARSIEQQQAVEAADEISFDEYLQQYFSEQGCCD